MAPGPGPLRQWWATVRRDWRPTQPISQRYGDPGRSRLNINACALNSSIFIFVVTFMGFIRYKRYVITSNVKWCCFELKAPKSVQVHILHRFHNDRRRQPSKGPANQSEIACKSVSKSKVQPTVSNILRGREVVRTFLNVSKLISQAT